jgi:hypothetical protein
VAVTQTRGNPLGHLILRGGAVPNYDSVAVAQAALAVHTTRRTGRLAAAELLRAATAAGQPGALLQRLVRQDPETRRWLSEWQQQGGERTVGGGLQP